jgi:hypothetical protein
VKWTYRKAISKTSLQWLHLLQRLSAAANSC